MKNKLALILALTICASAFSGCGGASSGESSKAAESSAEVAETADNSGDTIAEETASEKLLAESSTVCPQASISISTSSSRN